MAFAEPPAADLNLVILQSWI